MKPPIKTMPFPDDLGIRMVDMVRDPELIIKKIQQKMVEAKIICFNCHKFVDFKFTPTYYSFKCQCGYYIFYPPRSDRSFAYGFRFIPMNKGSDTNGDNRSVGKNAGKSSKSIRDHKLQGYK